MAEYWRLLDTGLRPAAQNIALDRALLEARQAEEIPSTLRFLRFAPCALVGSRQSPEQELDLDYCRASRIAVQRRITSGVAAYCDEGQLGWGLYLSLREAGTSDVRAILRRAGHAVAAGVSALGVEARVRAGGDIEVEGRRIAWAAAAVHGHALLVQGMLLLEGDPGRILMALRLSAAGLSEPVLAAARERLASLAGLLGGRPDAAAVKRLLAEAFESGFDVELREGDLGLTEHVRYRQALASIDTPDWVNLVSRPASEMRIAEAGARLRAAVVFEAPARILRQVWFAGEIENPPRRLLAELEDALRDTPLEQLDARMHRFFHGRSPEACAVAPAELASLVRRAVSQPLLARSA